MSAPIHRAARFDQLGPRTLYDILQLRVDVFIVEQECPYRELDGRDVRPDTLHLWIEDGGMVAAYLRLYPGEEGADWIGRVVTAPPHRGRGLGSALMIDAMARTRRALRISAQVRLAAWYAGFGFVRCGDDFDEDGMPHTPMRREASEEAGEPGRQGSQAG